MKQIKHFFWEVSFRLSATSLNYQERVRCLFYILKCYFVKTWWGSCWSNVLFSKYKLFIDTLCFMKHVNLRYWVSVLLSPKSKSSAWSREMLWKTCSDVQDKVFFQIFTPKLLVENWRWRSLTNSLNIRDIYIEWDVFKTC